MDPDLGVLELHVWKNKLQIFAGNKIFIIVIAPYFIANLFVQI